MGKKIEQVLSTIQVLCLIFLKNDCTSYCPPRKSCTTLTITKKNFMPQKITQPPLEPLPQKNNGPSLSCSYFRDRQRGDLLPRRVGHVQSLSFVFVLTLVENFRKRTMWSFTILLYWLSTEAYKARRSLASLGTLKN